jgi:hypothetical protein
MRVRLRADFASRTKDGRAHRGVTALEAYFVIGVNQEEFRVVDDKGEPILYPKDLFEVVDATLPSGWQFCEYPDGEYHLDPVATGAPGFYEDFFGSNGDRVAQSKAQQVLRETLETAMTTGSDEDKRLIGRDLGRLVRS